MRCFSVTCFCVLAGLSLVTFPARAQEREPAEPLPPPRQVSPPPLVLPGPPPPLYPVGRDIWQLYAVDRTGRFRPRVAYTPHGAFYVHNYAPYPWTASRQLEWMPYATD